MTTDDPNADSSDDFVDPSRPEPGAAHGFDGSPEESSPGASTPWPELEADDPADRFGSMARLPISGDFVERTLGKVLDDRARIRAEAESVDNIVFPAGFLDHFAPPTVTEDFVERTMRALTRAEESGDGATDEAASDRSPEDLELSRLLRAYGPDTISGGFVERTLDALGSDSPDGDAAFETALGAYEAPPVSADFVERTLESVLAARTAPALPTHPGWSWRGAALRLAAVVLVSAGIVFFSFGGSNGATDDPNTNVIAEAPNAFDLHLATHRLGTQLAVDREDALIVETNDPLLSMMQQAARARARRSGNLEERSGSNRNR